MEKIGIVDDGNVICKMTDEEWRTFKILGRAIENTVQDHWDLTPSNAHVILPEFSGVFGAIQAFALAQYRLNELQNVLDQFKEVLNKKTE